MSALVFIGEALADEPPLPDLPDYVFAVSPEHENLDLLHFGEARPTLIRFRVRINNRGFGTAWDEFLARLYKFADANDDGILTEAEANRPGWGQLVANPNAGFDGLPNLAQGDGRTVLEPKGGKVSLENFTRYVRDGLGHSPLLVQAFPNADPVDTAIFNQLDGDHDGALVATELASADALLRRLDADEDEMIDPSELDPTSDPLGRRFFGGNQSALDPLAGPFVSLATAEARKRSAARLLARYDGIDSTPRDDRLSTAESDLAPEAFRAADSSGDGRLDLAEIERFLASPTPAIVLLLRMTKVPGQSSTIELTAAAEGTSEPDSRIKTRPKKGLMLDLDGRQAPLAAVNNLQDFRSFFETQFQEADTNKDGSLDRPEAEKSNYFLGFFDVGDRNADGKLSKGELTLYLDRSADLVESRTSLGLMDSGRPVFEILDADGDGRLGRRELREAAKHLKSFDVDSDGRVRLAELPPTFRIMIGRGAIAPNRRRFNFDTYDTPSPPRPGSEGPEVAWFRRMDRNRDGDVSPREFLGPPGVFRKIDADGDGLIDEREAAKGP